MADKIKVALIEGFHPFDIIEYHQMFRSFDDVDYYPQFLENWAFNGPDKSQDYDVLMFYNMNMALEPEGQGFRPFVDKVLESLGSKGQGIFMWHHAILALPENKIISDVVGIEDRKFGFYGDQTFKVQIADKEHPITRGMEDFEMLDETYTMNEPSAESGSRVLLTTEHDPSMRALAWTRQYKDSPVFCFQSGHDHRTWQNPGFRKVLHRGIQWAAGRLD